MEEAIEQLLQIYPPRELVVPERRLAAVLVPLYRHDDEYGLIFTKRSETVPHHRGQMAFPGGAYEVRDPSLQHTALRESHEEIGLLAEHVRLLGQLDDLLTSNSNYLVRPFVGSIPYPYPFTLDYRETASIIAVPLRILQQQYVPEQEMREFEGRLVQSYFFEYAGHTIWGATAKIVKQFLEVLTPLAW